MHLRPPFTPPDAAALTDLGLRRPNNEDAFLCLPAAGLFCVADGMGGVQGGEVASGLIVEELRRAFEDSPAPPRTLSAAARLAGSAINRASRRTKAFADAHGYTGTGSTAALLLLDPADPAGALLLHAGDSRVYRLRAGRLEPLTVDHSLAASLNLPECELPDLFRGVITRAVGLAPTVRLDATPTDVRPGDLFLLCTDGLTNSLGDRRLQRLLAPHAAVALPALARTLVDAALAANGDDNITLILVRPALS